MRVWVVLPAYNEAENIPVIMGQLKSLVDDTYNLDLRLIVIDDASTDNTGELASDPRWRLSVTVLRNPRNLGLAGTFMRGVTEATKQAGDSDIIICMDADNSHLPGQIHSMVRYICEGRDVVIASRYRAGAVIKGVPMYRRFLSYGMSLLFRMIYPIKGVRDYSCGYRAYRAGILRKTLANINRQLFANDGFACMVGILLRLSRNGAICGEVPMILRYDQKAGSSKMRVGRTIARTLAVLIRERFKASNN